MKYQTGDLVLVKEINFHPRPLLRLHPRPHPHPHPLLHPRPRLSNTYGIITKTEKHTDIFQKDSTEADNGYVWYSQVDRQEYYFYENEIVGEVVK